MTEAKDALALEIEAFEAQREELEKHHMHKFVVFKDRKLVGAFDTVDAAANEAIRLFGKGPYLIRQVGAEPIRLPTTATMTPVHADR